MLDDDFKEIENFLKVDGNSELFLFTNFEEAIENLITTTTKENIQNGFTALHKLIYQTYTEFEKSQDDSSRDLAATVIILKKVLEVFKKIPEEEMFLNGEEKKIYLELVNSVVSSLQEKIESNIKIYEICAEYTTGIKEVLSTIE